MALEFLNKPGVSEFSKEFLKGVNTKIGEYISTAAVNGESDDTVMASAKAAYTAIQSAIESKLGLSFETVTGDIKSVTQPDPLKIYLQKDNDADKTWTLYTYKNNMWIGIGDASIDLINYWSKTDVDDMIEELEIDDLSSTVEALKTAIEAYTKATAAIPVSDITAIMNDMVNETDTFKTANATTPSGVTGGEATAGESDGQITGVSIDMEWSTDKIVWNGISGSTIDGLAAGTYYVRYKATSTKKASNAVTVVVAAAISEDEEPDDDLG